MDGGGNLVVEDSTDFISTILKTSQQDKVTDCGSNDLALLLITVYNKNQETHTTILNVFQVLSGSAGEDGTTLWRNPSWWLSREISLAELKDVGTSLKLANL